MTSKQIFSSTICSQMGGPASSMVGAIDKLRTTGLDSSQNELVVSKTNDLVHC